MKRGFENLVVWQEAKSLAIDTYALCRQPPLGKEWSLRDQMQRAAISISSNIAEGYERSTAKDELRFLSIAKGSASELRSQLLVVYGLGLIDKQTCESLADRCHRVGSLLFKFMKHKEGLAED
ncbi:MAG: four helix bundle protein [Opitutia bacterium]